MSPTLGEALELYEDGLREGLSSDAAIEKARMGTARPGDSWGLDLVASNYVEKLPGEDYFALIAIDLIDSLSLDLAGFLKLLEDFISERGIRLEFDDVFRGFIADLGDEEPYYHVNYDDDQHVIGAIFSIPLHLLGTFSNLPEIKYVHVDTSRPRINEP